MADLFRPWPFADLPQGEFRVVLADPPWSFDNWSAAGEKKNPKAHYKCEGLDWIKSLPVRDLANPEGAVCIMWATAPMLPQAIEVMKAWAFTFKSSGAWAKQSSTGQKWAFGPGYVFRSAAEFYLLGTIGKPVFKSRSVRNLIVAPVREHSRKPDQMRANIEQQFDGPYIELFAREAAPNWLAWGNEIGKFSKEEA